MDIEDETTMDIEDETTTHEEPKYPLC